MEQSIELAWPEEPREGGEEGRKGERPCLSAVGAQGPCRSVCCMFFCVCFGEGGTVLVLGWAMAQGSGSRILKGGCPLLL